jgi:hypothetical protein
MFIIRSGNASAVVAVEWVSEDRAAYVPECCSRRYLSVKGLGASHADGCPVDRAIRELLDEWGDGRAS